MRHVLLLDERILADGTHARTWASAAGPDRIAIRDDDGTTGELSIHAFERVMLRYGRPLDPEISLDGDRLALGDRGALRRLRYHAVVDATGRDYLVWERPDGEPLAAVATTITAALRYLVLRLAGERHVGPSGN
jgi:hypothetical protein